MAIGEGGTIFVGDQTTAWARPRARRWRYPCLPSLRRVRLRRVRHHAGGEVEEEELEDALLRSERLFIALRGEQGARGDALALRRDVEVGVDDAAALLGRRDRRVERKRLD